MKRKTFACINFKKKKSYNVQTKKWINTSNAYTLQVLKIKMICRLQDFSLTKDIGGLRTNGRFKFKMGGWWVGGSWVSEFIFLYMLLCEFFLFLRKYIDKTGQTSKYFEVLLRNTKIYKILKFYLLMIFSIPPTE